jgi:hypothetical protein
MDTKMDLCRSSRSLGAVIAVLALSQCTSSTYAPERAACERLINCIAQVEPSAGAGALQSYGDGSVCWNSAQAAAVCGNACKSSLAELTAGYPGVPQCGCQSDADCPGSGRRHCDVTTGLCQVCVDDAQCPGASPHCTPASSPLMDRACVPCTPQTQATDCPSARPYCSANAQCVVCTDDGQCEVGLCRAGKCNPDCYLTAEVLFREIVSGIDHSKVHCSNGLALAQCAWTNCHANGACDGSEWAGPCADCRDQYCATIACTLEQPCLP